MASSSWFDGVLKSPIIRCHSKCSLNSEDKLNFVLHHWHVDKKDSLSKNCELFRMKLSVAQLIKLSTSVKPFKVSVKLKD